MNKFVKWITLFLVSVVLLGCGEDTPEDIAVSYVKSLSSADIDNAKEFATEKVHKRIDALEGLCNKEYYKELSDEVFRIEDKIRFNKEYKKMFEKKAEKAVEIIKSLMHKYGDIKDIKELPSDKQEEFLTELIDKLSELTEPIVSHVVNNLKIDIKHEDIVKKLLSRYIAKKAFMKRSMFQSKRDYLIGIIEDANYADPKNMSEGCVAKYTEYGFIESVNFLEVKNESPDEARVRLELIDTKGKSNKVSIDVEKIKGEWKVSSLSLQDW